MSVDDDFRAALDQLGASGLRRQLRTIDGAQNARVRINGRSVICLCSNNYLGLASHPALAEAAARAAHDFGVGSGASRLISGSMRLHDELEQRLAAFQRTEACILFNSGYHANVGTIAALVAEGDVVFSDELNHASIIDGCRLSRATIRVYAHRDMNGLENALRRNGGRRKLIVTDSLFSMDGTAAPLRDICDLAERYGAMVMIDEAHATGIVGERGAGLAESLGVEDRIAVHMGTLGKALGTFGAFVAGSRTLVDYLINKARPLIFTTALPPPMVAAALAALGIVESEPARRMAVRRNARRLRIGLRATGFGVDDSEGHIIPVMIGEADATMRMSAALLEHGVFAHGIRPPTVPNGTARIRATVMATHTDADIDEAIGAFAQARVGLAR